MSLRAITLKTMTMMMIMIMIVTLWAPIRSSCPGVRDSSTIQFRLAVIDDDNDNDNDEDNDNDSDRVRDGSTDAATILRKY